MSSYALSAWSHLALSAYYYTTLPERLRRRTARAANGTAPIMVLFYHRVSDQHINDWTMSESAFAQQVRWLQRHFDLISLETAQRRIESGTNASPAVAITFDDGYADNCDFALPTLIRDRIPATYFVTSQNVLTGAPFPHDVAVGVPLEPNTVEQLKSIANAGIEIGAHTRTHLDLGADHGPERIVDEVVGCRDELAKAIGCPIRYFAFPYGLHTNLNADVFQLAKSAGYRGVCSAYGGYNFPGEDGFHLQRIHADPELVRLKNWLTVDPRKERQLQRFVYQEESSAGQRELAPSESRVSTHSSEPARPHP